MEKSRAVTFLEEVGERVHLFIQPTNAEALETFLSGFVRGILLERSSVNDTMYRRARETVTKSRGWEYTAAASWRQLRARGMSEEDVISERLAIETGTWRLLDPPESWRERV